MKNAVRLVEVENQFEVIEQKSFFGFKYWETIWRGHSKSAAETAFENMVRYGTHLNVLKEHNPVLEKTLNHW